jgi:hypothetical protein
MTIFSISTLSAKVVYLFTDVEVYKILKRSRSHFSCLLFFINLLRKAKKNEIFQCFCIVNIIKRENCHNPIFYSFYFIFLIKIMKNDDEIKWNKKMMKWMKNKLKFGSRQHKLKV